MVPGGTVVYIRTNSIRFSLLFLISLLCVCRRPLRNSGNKCEKKRYMPTDALDRFRRRRMEDLLRGSTAVAPSLQPYVAGAGAVESGLYRFLSPISIQVRFSQAFCSNHRSARTRRARSTGEERGGGEGGGQRHSTLWRRWVIRLEQTLCALCKSEGTLTSPLILGRHGERPSCIP